MMSSCFDRLALVLFFGMTLAIAPDIQAATCGEPSPTVVRGGNLYDQPEPEKLNERQIKSLEAFFAFADRRWRGVGEEVQCLGSAANPRPRITEFRLKADGEGKAEGMTLEMEMSHDEGVRRQILGLQIEDGLLKLRDGGLNQVHIVSLQPKAVAIRIAYARRQRGGGAVHMEAFWWFDRAGNALVIRSETYAAGGLSGTARWSLKPS